MYVMQTFNLTFMQIRQTWKEAPIKEGKLDYDAFVNLIKRGNQDIQDQHFYRKGEK